jgi:hypothetical protein
MQLFFVASGFTNTPLTVLQGLQGCGCLPESTTAVMVACCYVCELFWLWLVVCVRLWDKARCVWWLSSSLLLPWCCVDKAMGNPTQNPVHRNRPHAGDLPFAARNTLYFSTSDRWVLFGVGHKPRQPPVLGCRQQEHVLVGMLLCRHPTARLLLGFGVSGPRSSVMVGCYRRRFQCFSSAGVWSLLLYAAPGLLSL